MELLEICIDQSVTEMEKCMVQTQANDVALKHHTFDNGKKPSTFLF